MKFFFVTAPIWLITNASVRECDMHFFVEIVES